jgi:hypothetical protein
LNSPHTSFSFIPLPPLFLESFIISHFFIYIHMYPAFSLYSPSYTLSPQLLTFHWYQPHRQDLFHLLVLWFFKRRIMTFFFV